MQISRTLWQAYQDLLAADTATLAAATAMKVKLAAASFVPGLDLVVGGLTEATFTGSAAKSAGIGTAQKFYDPVTGLRTVQLLEPAGGWTWICTATPVTPEVIYGFWVTDTAGTLLIGAQLFDQPVTISLSGQAIIIPRIRMDFLLGSPI